MYYKNIDKDSRNEDNLIGRKLADRFGRDVARMFYAHHGRSVGSDFED
jgi:hypothetical protein